MKCFSLLASMTFVCLAGGASAQIGNGPNPFTFNLQTLNDLTNGVLIIAEANPDLTYTTTGLFIDNAFRNLSAGSHTFQINLGQVSTFNTSYVFLANYSGGVSIGLKSAFANFVTAPGTGRDWSTLFRLDSEANTVGVLNDAYSTNAGEIPAAVDWLITFGSRYGTRWSSLANPFTLVSFSDPTITGSGSLVANPVPEPTTLITVGAGAVALLRRKKRSTHRA